MDSDSIDRSTIKNILALSESMLSALREDDWESFNQYNERREKLVDQIKKELEYEVPEDVQKLFGEISRLNSEIIQYIESKKDVVREALSKLSLQKRASDSYLDTQN